MNLLKLNINRPKQITKEDAYIAFACCGLGILISWILYDTFALAILSIFMYFPAKKAYITYMDKKKKKDVEKQFSDFLYYISISFSLGRNLMQGIEESISNLKEIYSDDAYIVNDLEEILFKYQSGNVEDVSPLEKYDNEDISDFIRVYHNCKETGGNIVEAVNSASRIITEKIQVNNEIILQSSQRKLEGRIIALMPFVIVVFLKVTGPDYLEVMYTTLAGRIIMSIVLAATMVSWLLVEKITKVSV